MGLKSFNPYTASRRFITVVDKSHITKQEPEKALLEPKKRSGGRNNHGEIVVWHRGGGHKKQYRKVDFRRDKVGIPAKVAAIEYDPNRSANLALLHYADGDKRYILHPVGFRPAKARTFFRAMRCRSSTFLPARWFTTSS
jgi:large subunit ribosomal protein L2